MGNIINLAEKSLINFYEHFKVQGSDNPCELYWEEQQWKVRKVAYEGEWIYVQSPLDVDFIDKQELEKKLSNVLLTQYHYLVSFKPEDKFQIRKIESHFGKERCDNFCEKMNEFYSSLKSVIRTSFEKNKKSGKNEEKK